MPGLWRHAGLVKALKVAKEYLVEREKEEAALISQYADITDVKEWQVVLSEWKIQAKVRYITDYQAKRFARFLNGWYNDRCQCCCRGNDIITWKGDGFRRPDGRYGTRNDRSYFTSETVIEFAYTKEVQNSDGYLEGIPVWTISSVEHNKKDYYIVGYPDVDLNRLKVRVRE